MHQKTKQNLDKMQELGINIKRFNYDDCVEILIDKYIEAFTACEFNEEDRMRIELKRIQQPTN